MNVDDQILFKKMIEALIRIESEAGRALRNMAAHSDPLVAVLLESIQHTASQALSGNSIKQNEGTI